MKDSQPDWRDGLWARFAALFDGAAPFATRIGTLPDGWRETVEAFCGSLVAALAGEPDGHVRLARMENVRGAMEIELKASAPRWEFKDEIDELAGLATARSACTCETCGQAGKRYRDGVRTLAACPVHMPRAAVELTPNWPAVRIRREIVAGRSRITECKVYDRAGDRFVFATPADLGIPDQP